MRDISRETRKEAMILAVGACIVSVAAVAFIFAAPKIVDAYGQGGYYSQPYYQTYYQSGYYSQSSYSPSVTKVVVLTSGTSWTVPSDFTNTNTVEVIGGGGAGGAASGTGGGGGGGGAYSKVSNLSLTPGNSVTIQVGTGGSSQGAGGGDSWFNGASCGAASTCAKGGGGGATGGTFPAGGSGGAAGSGVGATKYSGGSGGYGYSGTDASGGGGGSAGPGGDGKNGGSNDGYERGGGGGGSGGGNSSVGRSSADGGAGGAGHSGSNGAGGQGQSSSATGGAGTAGIQWGSYGSGGGGGGSNDGTGGAGGLYGGGGGGGEPSFGAGGQGLIIVHYTPLAPPGAPGTPSFSSVDFTTMTVSWTAASGATSYKLERCTGSGCSNYSEIATGISSPRNETGLSTGTVYRYRVRGTNGGGDGSYSSAAEQSTLGVPSAPGTPTFSNVNLTSMRVSWTAPGGNPASYKVERCQGVGCSSFTEIATGLTSLYIDQAGLEPGATYGFRVRATNQAGDGSYSGTGSQATVTCGNGGNGGEVSGYAWSDTTGWISLNGVTDTCTQQTYGLDVDDDGDITGYAWSETLGWISAEASDVSGCPTSPCSPKIKSDSYFEGWLKAKSASDGWDGWISLGDTNTGDGIDYGLAVSGNDVIGYAWGSDVVGWIAFTDAESTYSPCSPTYTPTGPTTYDNDCTIPVENDECPPGEIAITGPVPCAVPGDATGELVISPALVPTGNTTEVSWNVIDTTSCRVFGANGDEWYGSGTDTKTSSAIISTTLYTLECTNSLGEATTTIDTAYATVVPTWVEK